MGVVHKTYDVFKWVKNRGDIDTTTDFSNRPVFFRAKGKQALELLAFSSLWDHRL